MYPRSFDPCDYFCSSQSQPVSFLIAPHVRDTFLMPPTTLAMMPADVLLRLHILLGLQVAPVFAWTAPFVTPLVVVAHARAQLELLEVLLETEVPCGFTFFSRVRMYCALCSAAVAAVAAPLLAVAELDLFYPGMKEAAQGHVFWATYRDTTDAVGCGCLLRTSAWTCRITWHWTWAFHLILLRHGWNSMLRTTSRPCRMRSLCSTAVPTRFPSTPEIARQIVRQDAFCNSTSSALRGLWRLRSQRWTPPGSTSECTGDSHELCCTSSSECTGDSHELCCTDEIF